MLVVAAIGFVCGLIARSWRQLVLLWIGLMALTVGMQVAGGFVAAGRPDAHAALVGGLVVASSLYAAVVVSVATMIGHAVRMAWRKFAKGEAGRFER